MEKYIVGREITEGIYDLDECPIFDDLEGAIRDLLVRIDDADIDVSGSLQVLQCEVTEHDDVLAYQPVLSGLVVATLVAMQKLERND